MLSDAVNVKPAGIKVFCNKLGLPLDRRTRNFIILCVLVKTVSPLNGVIALPWAILTSKCAVVGMTVCTNWTTPVQVGSVR